MNDPDIAGPISKNHPLKKIVEEVKKGSSKWMKTDGPKNAEFQWQAGYAAFSVSRSNVANVTRYIENQEEHHRKMTFQVENEAQECRCPGLLKPSRGRSHR